MTDHEHVWGLTLEFDTDDPEFVRGVEVGMLYSALANEPYRFRQQVSAKNAEMVLRIAEATGRAVRTLSEVDDWLDVEFAEGAPDEP